MAALSPVPVSELALERFAAIERPEALARVRAGVLRARTELAGRRVWHLNSTARGGGVAEMLVTLLAYARGAGVDARWLVVEGDEPFFRVTKRIHNRLHGAAGDGGPLGAEEHEIYERTLHAAAAELEQLVEPDDVVFLHDPQTAGLAPALARRGVATVWRCHIGIDAPNAVSREALDFLEPYIAPADAWVFSRREFVFSDLDPDRVRVIPPSIDAFAPKNEALDDGAACAILAAAGLGADGAGPEPAYLRLDGTRARVSRRAAVLEERPLRRGEPYLLQVSRWDRLKDPVGVIDGFAEYVAPRTDAHLVYAGPAVEAVADDPEGAQVLAQAEERWHALPPPARQRVHLALLPMDDTQENGAIVNALQREATVVVQKSIAEGFGLTVAEAMWKSRAVVASAVGGIRDQIADGSCGVLLDDPTDLEAYGAAVVDLLGDPARRRAMGAAARERVRDRFLGTRSLLDYLALLEALLGARSP